jgi:hypothetical protein
MKVFIIAPKPNSTAGILPHSAIVASESRPEYCYYEGNANGASNLHTFWGKLQCAIGRMLASYPTTAKQFIPTAEQHILAEMECGLDTITHTYRLHFTKIIDPNALEAWAGESVTTICGLKWDPLPLYKDLIDQIIALDIPVKPTTHTITNRWGDSISLDLMGKSARLLPSMSKPD